MGFWDWFRPQRDWYWFVVWTRPVFSKTWMKVFESDEAEKYTEDESLSEQNSLTLEWFSEDEIAATARYVWDDDINDWVLLNWV